MKINKTRYDILRQAIRSVLVNEWMISVFGDEFDEPIVWTVFWASVGEQTPEKTRLFAATLFTAVDIAEHLNGMEITVDWQEDATIRDMINKNHHTAREFYKSLVQEVSELIKADQWNAVKTLLKEES